MSITLSEKKELVANLEKLIDDSKSVVFVKFDGLRVADSNELRRSLQKEDVGYIVSKKTLLKRALDSQKYEGELPELPGQVALAYSEDLLSAPREIYGFQKKLKGQVSIVGGIFEGKYMNSEEMLNIATIPPLETLRGMFVNLINSPIQRLAVVLNQIATNK